MILKNYQSLVLGMDSNLLLSSLVPNYLGLVPIYVR